MSQLHGCCLHLFVTDSMTEVTMRPQPSEEEIQFILDAIADYLTVQVWNRVFVILA